MNILEAKKYGKAQLSFSPTPELDTAVILQHVTGFDRTKLLLKRDFSLSREQEQSFTAAIEKRKTGLPVAYITGQKEFFGFNFFVSPAVLIPKPDTELLVEQALNALGLFYEKMENADGSLKKIPEICDMCCGSGCVGLSVLKALAENDGISPENLPKMTFADISEPALEICQKNARHLLDFDESLPARLRFIRSNLFENIPHYSFDFILTNPPYVPHSESLELLKDGRSEPLLALDGDVTAEGDFSGTEDGLFLIRRLIPQCFERLAPGGMLLMETGEYNARETALLFEKARLKNVLIKKDLNGMLRNVMGTKPYSSGETKSGC